MPDARGYGDSAKPVAGYDGLTIKEDLRQLLQALGHRQAFVMGRDMGAPVADPRSVTAADKAEVVRALRSPGGLHGSFGWYRDSLLTGRQIVEATQGRVLQVPVLALNGQYGHPGVAEQFEGIAATVDGATIPACGHLLAEEQPQAVVAQIVAFAERHGRRLATG